MDWILNDELGLKVSHVVGWAAATAMVVGGIIPYVPQYRQIKDTQDADGFSLHVCLALLVANSLRILYWFSRHYELPLLVQSIVMNLTMFLMIHLCVKVKRASAIMKTRDRVFAGADALDMTTTAATTKGGSLHRLDHDEPPGQQQAHQRVGSIVSTGDVTLDEGSGVPVVGDQSILGTLRRRPSKHSLIDFDRRYFWAWTDFLSYLLFMVGFWIIGAIVTYLLLNVQWFMETVGFLGVFTEAMLGLPQFLRNFNNKSTLGMSISMVIMWTLGDMFKTLYFLVRAAPVQFWICGTLQVCLDIAILLQVYLYRKSPAPRDSHRGD